MERGNASAQPHRSRLLGIDVETLVATAIDDLPQMIAQLEDALSTLLAAEDHDPHA